MKRDYIDFFVVKDEHQAIHARLELWTRWVKVRPRGWLTTPMFRHYRSHSWQWHRPEVQTPINTLDATEIEKAVAQLPEKNMWALRWSYVFQTGPLNFARALNVSPAGLLSLVTDGRTMLKNRLKESP